MRTKAAARVAAGMATVAAVEITKTVTVATATGGTAPQTKFHHGLETKMPNAGASAISRWDNTEAKVPRTIAAQTNVSKTMSTTVSATIRSSMQQRSRCR